MVPLVWSTEQTILLMPSFSQTTCSWALRGQLFASACSRGCLTTSDFVPQKASIIILLSSLK